MYLVSLCPLDNLAKFDRIFDNGYDMHADVRFSAHDNNFHSAPARRADYPAAFRAFKRIYLVHFLE